MEGGGWVFQWGEGGDLAATFHGPGAISDCKMYWTCGFCKHERIVLHLESQLDLDKMNSELRAMRKSGPKRKAASALQRQPPSPAKKKKGAAAAAESLPKRRKK